MEKDMKKATLRSALIFLAISFYTIVLFSQTVDLNKYIGVKSYVKNLSFNSINKSSRSFSHVLTLYKDIKYKIVVFSSNPDITISILDSIKNKTFEKTDKSVIKDRYYFFTIDYTAKFKGKYNIIVRANKSQDFRYYFLATYEAANATDIPEKQNRTILAFDKLSKDFLGNNEIQVNEQKYFRRLIGFLYFPTGQYNHRLLYGDNIFMAQSFTLDKNQKLTFYYGSDIKENAMINVDLKEETFGSEFQDFSSKSFVTKINKDSLYTIDLDSEDPTILFSYKLIENKTTTDIDLALTKPVPERTNRFSVNLAGYVTNWVEKPDNKVVIHRYNGNDAATFTLDQNLVGSAFNFDVNIPLLPGKNKLVIEASVDEEKKTIEKEIIAESDKKSLLIELTWNTSGTDMDLYVVKPDGEVVCFENQNDNNPAKGWLDIDDKDGYGPERFRIDSPKTGKYKIYAHYYNGDVPTEVYAKTITGGTIKELKGKLTISSKTNSAIDNIGNGQDWRLLGEVEVK
jgi:hypothetical protein